MLKKIIAVLLSLSVLTGFGYAFMQPASTTRLVESKKGTFNLEAHWKQGNVVALVRHAERCDRSDNLCLDGKSGITEPGSKEAITVGQKFSYLPDAKTTIYNSPVKRTVQTASFMFPDKSVEQKWLREGCKRHLLENILKNKKEGVNLVLVTHSTCIDKLANTDGEKLVNINIHDASAYNSSTFLAIDENSSQVYTLGYLLADDWDRAFNQAIF